MRALRLILPAVLLLALAAGWFCVIRVGADEVALAGPAGTGQEPAVLGPGFHFVSPFSRLTRLGTRLQEASGETLVTPESGGEVMMHYTVSGSLDPGKAGAVFSAIGDRSMEEFLTSQVGALLRQDAASADPVDLLTPEYRSKVSEAIAEAMKRGGFSEAAVSIKAPDDATLLAAAQALAPEGRAYRLRQTIAEALLEPGRADSWRLHTAMGMVNESTKQFTEAEKDYLDALASQPEALPPMARLVAIYSAAGEWNRLQRVLDAALSADPNSPQHINWTAMVLIKQDDLVGAERILRRGLEVAPTNTTLLMNLGGLYLKMDKPDEALDLLRKAAEAEPDSPAVLFNLGSALASTDRNEEALGYLERAEKAGSLNYPLARTLAMVYGRLGHPAKAAEYEAKARKLEASSVRPSPNRPDTSQAADEPGRRAG